LAALKLDRKIATAEPEPLIYEAAMKRLELAIQDYHSRGHDVGDIRTVSHTFEVDHMLPFTNNKCVLIC
jgi:hypothetical protein